MGECLRMNLAWPVARFGAICRIIPSVSGPVVAVALLLTSSLCIAQQADDDEPSDVQQTIETRQHHYADLGAAFKSMNDELRNKKPVISMYGRYLKQLVELARLLQDQERFFPAGTGPESGHKTAALAQIWTDKRQFAAKGNALVVEVEKLQKVVTDGGAMQAIANQHKVVGKTCEDCHKAFRAKDD
jgi:cytochrome c556